MISHRLGQAFGDERIVDFCQGCCSVIVCCTSVYVGFCSVTRGVFISGLGYGFGGLCQVFRSQFFCRMEELCWRAVSTAAAEEE